ncbi:MAG: glycosyltransferase family 4 protein [Firmicutes bacterium]|nr:glycosyltransferase family 4 protein [Bacillota bacterium]
MRIAVFSDSYKPYVSGVVNSLDTFGRELRKMGHQWYIFAPTYPGYVDDEPGVFRFVSVAAPTNPDYRLAIPLSLAVCRRLRELQIDVVHTHSPFLMGGLGARAARRLKLPLVFTYHTLYEEYVHYSPVARGFARRLMRRISKQYCNRCDTVIVPTQAIRELLDRYGVQTEVVVNPTGIDLSRYENLDRSFLRVNYGIPADHRVLLFVGRLGKEKNVHFLIRAFSKIADEDDKVTLVMVGGGPERADLEEFARSLGVQQRVIFAGPKQPGEMPTVYAGADIFVFTSTTDTQGMVITEAMAAGLPVVAVKAYGSGNVVDHGVNGLLTSVDEAEFATAVTTLLRDASLFSRLALGTRQKAEEMSSTRCAKRLEQVYLAAIEKKARVQKRWNTPNGGFGS